MNISVTLTPKTSLEKALKKVGIEDPATITTLAIVGRVIESDMKYIRNNMGETLQELDLSGTFLKKNEIPDWTFGGSLISVTIPDSVTKIHRYTFRCKNLTTIKANSENPVFASIDGVLFSKDKTELIKYPEGRQGDYVIPDSVTKINEAAFCRCIGLTSITIPASVIEIGSQSFLDCSGLTSIVIPDSVTKIGESAFRHCSNLTSVIIPDSIRKIESGTFAYCSGLKSVAIPDSVTEIRLWAFQCCTALTSIAIPQSVTKIEQEYWGAFFRCTTTITVHPDNPIFSSEKGVLFNKDKTELIAYPNIRQGKYHIPNSVTKIGNWAFSGCEDLISIIIPDTVTNIGEDAFWYHRLNIMVHPDNPVYKVVDGKIERK